MNPDTKTWVLSLSDMKVSFEPLIPPHPIIPTPLINLLSTGQGGSRRQDPAYTGPLVPTTPLSLEAFLRLGIKPGALVYRPYEHFLRRRHDPELAKLEYDHAEGVRQEKLDRLMQERQRLESEKARCDAEARGTGAGRRASGNTDREMVQREARRLDVIRRRLQKELDQALTHERTRQELETKGRTKIALLEKRAEERQRAKKNADLAWQAQQKAKEVQRRQVHCMPRIRRWEGGFLL